MFTLQTDVEVDGRLFTITNNGDFRMVLDCFKALSDEDLSEDCRVLASLLIFYNEFNDIEDIESVQDIAQDLVKAMYSFFNCGQVEAPGAKTERNLIDWEQDSQMICSAINNVANTEVRALEYLHWWTFMGYYTAVGKSTLSTVVSIRDKIINHKKMEKWEKDFKKDNPRYFIWNSSTVADREAENIIKGIWNVGGDN